MNRLGIAFILGALIIAAIFSGLVYKHQHSKSVTPEVLPSSMQVLVTTRSINRGEILKDADLAWQQWPRNDLSPKFILEGVRKKEDFIGAMTRKPLNPGQPITDSMVVAKENLSPLAGILKPGMRAVTVQVSQASAIAGLVTPGDIVDVILTYGFNKSASVEKEYLSKTVLTNVDVLAVDQEMTPSSPSASTTTRNSQGMNLMKDITLEVTPEQAEILAISASMGTITLSLSSPVNSKNPLDVSQVRTLDSAEVGAMANDENSVRLTLIHGDKSEQVGE